MKRQIQNMAVQTQATESVSFADFPAPFQETVANGQPPESIAGEPFREMRPSIDAKCNGRRRFGPGYRNELGFRPLF
jgi:hypothetical protein